MRLFFNSIVAAALGVAVSARAADERPVTVGERATRTEKHQKERPASKGAPKPRSGKQAPAVNHGHGSKPAAAPCEEVKPCSIE